MPVSIVGRTWMIIGAVVVLGLFSFYANWEITKGAEFHRRNFLHLKYADILTTQVADLPAHAADPTEQVKAIHQTVEMIKAQPVACLELLNPVDRLMLHLIGTYQAVTLCQDDLALADQTLAKIADFEGRRASFNEMLKVLQEGEEGFKSKSAQLEGNVDKTVQFVSTSMNWLIIIVGLGCVGFVYQVGRGISRPVLALSGTMTCLAEGDLNVEVPGTGRHDELGKIAEAVLVFKKSMVESERLGAEKELQRQADTARAAKLTELTKNFDAKVTGLLKTVGDASKELESTATSMAIMAEQAGGQPK